MQRVIIALSIAVLILLGGCKKPPTKPAPAPNKLVASKLTVLVIEDPGIATGLGLLRGEWSERAGGELVVNESTAAEVLSAELLAADVIIYPSRLVGELVARDWIRPVRKSVLESEEVDTDNMYPLIRDHVLTYGNAVFGLSLGDAPLMLRSRTEVQVAENASWTQVSTANTNDNLQLRFPYAIALLARSVAYAQGRSDSFSCFDAESMRPQITEPPFAKALQDMVASKNSSDGGQPEYAFGWPSRGSDDANSYAALPIQRKTYQSLRRTWEENEATRPVTFLGFAGRSVSVARATRNSSSAFKLLNWLVSDGVASQVSPRSDATLWFRKSQASNAGKWMPDGNADSETVALVGELLSANQFFLVPRIQAIDDYLSSLDKSVKAAIVANDAADETIDATLANLAAEWEAITDRVGREGQRTAYRMHLGLDDSAD